MYQTIQLQTFTSHMMLDIMENNDGIQKEEIDIKDDHNLQQKFIQRKTSKLKPIKEQNSSNSDINANQQHKASSSSSQVDYNIRAEQQQMMSMSPSPNMFNQKSPTKQYYRDSVNNDSSFLNNYSQFPDNTPNINDMSLLARNQQSTRIYHKSIIPKLEIEQKCKMYKKKNWTDTQLIIQQNKVAFFQYNFQIDDLKKIKIISHFNYKTKLQGIIKMQIKNYICLISLPFEKMINQLPSAFYIFAKIIQKKMALKGFPVDINYVSSQKLTRLPLDDYYIYGHIYKKSQHLGNWNLRFIIITKQGIYSYHNQQKQEYSFSISNKSIKYLWTRFDLQNNYLIVKIKHGMFKTEFAIPLRQFSLKSTKNWLYSFFRIMPGLTL